MVSLFRSRLRMSSPRRPAAAAHAVGTIGDSLQLVDHELGNHQLAVDDLGVDDVGDAAVDDDAGVEDARPGAFDLAGEFHVGDDEAEVVLGLQEQADAGIAEHQPQDQLDPDPGWVGFRDVRRHQGLDHELGDVGQEHADDEAEIDRGDHVEPLAADAQVDRHNPPGK